MKRALITAVIAALMIFAVLAVPTSAQGIFDMECPDCHGSGKIIKEKPCDVCLSTGKITKVCNVCLGTGKITKVCDACHGAGTVIKNCTTCEGTGIMPGTAKPVVLGSQYSYRKIEEFTQVWLEVQNQGDASCYVWVTFRGKYDEVVTSKVVLKPSDIYRFESVLQKEEYRSDEVTYELHYEKLACQTCGGTGKISDICSECKGTGEISGICSECKGVGKIAVTCLNCGGDGKVEFEVTCPRCGGLGYVTDWTKIGIVSVVGAGAIIGVIAFAIKRGKKSAT